MLLFSQVIATARLFSLLQCRVTVSAENKSKPLAWSDLHQVRKNSGQACCRLSSALRWQHKAPELTGQSTATPHHKTGLHWDFSWTEIRQRKRERQRGGGKKGETQRKREKECRDGQKWITIRKGRGVEDTETEWWWSDPKSQQLRKKKTPTMHWDCFLSFPVSSGALPFCSVLSGSLIKQIPDWSWSLPTPQGCRQLVTLSCRMLFLTPTLFFIFAYIFIWEVADFQPQPQSHS